MARDKKTDRRDLRLVYAGGLMALGVAGLVGGAHLGDVRLGAGDVAIQLGKGEQGLQLDIAGRTCPPSCGVDVTWRPADWLKI
jgi:hypothetical protein